MERHIPFKVKSKIFRTGYSNNVFMTIKDTSIDVNGLLKRNKYFKSIQMMCSIENDYKPLSKMFDTANKCLSKTIFSV